MQDHTAPPGAAWRLGKGPFLFSGTPPICSGELDLINDSDEKVKVRAIPVGGPKERSAASPGLTQVRLAARLAPHGSARVPAHVELDPGTPAGRYAVELICADQREPAVVHVFERPAVEVEPRPIRLQGVGGESHGAQVILRNHGNVVETIPKLVLVFLEEQNWIGRSLVQTLQQVEKEDTQSYLDRVLSELKGSVARPARVEVQGEATPLTPGESREIEIEITLPAQLIKGRSYTGSTRFMSGTLGFDVICNGSGSSTKRRPR